MMSETKSTYWLSRFTLQSWRQRVAQSHRLAAHPTTEISMSPNNWFPGRGRPSEYARLIPDPASWEFYDRDLNPRNWAVKKKVLATTMVTQISWLVQFASAVDASNTAGLEEKFKVGPYISSLATALYLIGFAFGAPFAGPLSEKMGRNPVYVLSLFFFMIATLVAAVSQSLSLFLCARLAAGFFGSAPLVCAGGTISDLWCAADQLLAFPLYAAAGFSGLSAGPAVAGIMAQAFGIMSPAMTEWATLTISGIVFVTILLFQPETYARILLRWKTDLIIDNMKPEERDLVFPPRGITSLADDCRRLGKGIWTAIKRPLRIGIQEPIILLLTFNLSMIYLILFTLLPGYTAIFTDIYHMKPAAQGVTFYGLGVGMIFGLWFALALAWWWRRRHDEPSLPGLGPEARLDYAIIGQPAIALALFWMGFTAREDISFWSPLCATVLLGFGVICVFMTSYMYIIHAFGAYAATGLVFITLVRYLFAGIMVVAGVAMFKHVGVMKTLAILGTIASLLVPIPYAMVYWGSRLRLMSIRAAGNH